MANTLTEYIASQDDLVHEAALALPHQFSQCTHPLGPIRQSVYLCLTCAEPRGICSACSIACHTDHEQVELFPKRHFRCDCPTTSLAHPCTLHTKLEEPNTSNTYGQNFVGAFCRCGRPYDASKERETMIQCLACEDWYHESCLNLRERPSSREPTPEPSAPSAEDAEHEDARSDASSSGLPPPLITADDYDCLICASCVRSMPVLSRWAGTPGVLLVVRDGPDAVWRILDESRDSGDEPTDVTEENADGPVLGQKRPSSPSAAESDAKRPRVSPPPQTSPTSCLAPPRSALAEKIMSTTFKDAVLGAGDIFLTDGWRSRWCRCESCLPDLAAHPYLLEEEETYEPPEDPDSQLSLEELGLRALERIPRERALDGIRAFNDMRDDLVQFLRPFAQNGKAVSEEDVRAFFEAKTEAARQG
ncbi:hypothetical protein FA95DRAFT_1565342 [Auriscalpium vulgare]|uniref:Uncharacterized protein n=1 Tax=Auriscalpium vulgare TaxID=40419 RepID=A0ACB8RBD3_9AGAM|nr:hypothetical protein FA95DRAFT_1565342 [Auriscalpium vulgare]